MLRALLEQQTSEASSPKRCMSPKRGLFSKRSMSVGEMNTTASTIADGDRTDRPRDSARETSTTHEVKEHGKERRTEERSKLKARSGEGIGLDKKRNERSSGDLRSRQRLLQKELVAIKSRQFALAGERAEASVRGLAGGIGSDPAQVQARLEALVQSRPVNLPSLDLERPVTGPKGAPTSRPGSGLADQARLLKTSGTAPAGSAPLGAVGWSGVYLADV